MSEEARNLEIVRKAYEGLHSWDLELLTADFTDETITIEPEELPYGGTWRGRAGLLAMATKAGEVWQEIDSKVIQLTSGGEYVIGYVDFTGIGRATGKRVNFNIAEVWQIRDGKVVFLNIIYGDVAKACEALGGARVRQTA